MKGHPGDEAAPLLELRNVESGYIRQLLVLRGVSLLVPQGGCVALLGSNGAGKSTLLKTVMGLIDDEPRKGEVYVKGVLVNGWEAERIARRGVAYVIEGRGVFAELTVLENLQLGAYHRNGASEIKGDLERVFTIFPHLAQRRRQSAGTLSGGEQQMLAIGRALLGRPELLMLDEPSLGLAPRLVDEIFRVIKEVNETGVGILLVEQNANQALAIADHAYVLEAGRIMLGGSARELAANENVKELYLGLSAGEQGRMHVRRRRRRWN